MAMLSLLQDAETKAAGAQVEVHSLLSANAALTNANAALQNDVSILRQENVANASHLEAFTTQVQALQAAAEQQQHLLSEQELLVSQLRTEAAASHEQLQQVEAQLMGARQDATSRQQSYEAERQAWSLLEEQLRARLHDHTSSAESQRKSLELDHMSLLASLRETEEQASSANSARRQSLALLDTMKAENEQTTGALEVSQHELARLRMQHDDDLRTHQKLVAQVEVLQSANEHQDEQLRIDRTLIEQLEFSIATAQQHIAHDQLQLQATLLAAQAVKHACDESRVAWDQREQYLLSRLSHFESSTVDSQSVNANLLREVSELKSTCMTLNHEKDDLIAAIRTARDSQEGVAHELAAAQSTIEQSAAALLARDALVSKLQSELSAAIEEAKSSRALCDQQDKVLAEQNSRIAQQDDELALLMVEVQRVNADLAASIAKVVAKEELLASQDATLTQHSQHALLVQAEKQELEGRLQQAIDKQQHLIADQENLSERLNADARQLQQQCELLTTQLHATRDERANALHENDSLRAEQLNERQQWESLQVKQSEELQTAEQRLISVQADALATINIAQLQTDSDGLRAQLNVVCADLEQLTTHSQALSATTDQQQQLIGDHEALITHLRADASLAQEQLEAAAVQIADLTRCLQDGSEQAATAGENWSQERSELLSALQERENQALLANAAALSTQDGLQRSIAAIQVNVGQLQVDKDALLGLVQERDASIMLLQQQVDDLQEQCSHQATTIEQQELSLGDAQLTGQRLTLQLQEANAAVEQTCVVRDALQVDYDTTLQELAATQEQLQQVSTLLEQTTAARDALQSEHDATCRALTESQDQLQSIGDQLHESQLQYSALAEERHTLAETIQSLQVTLDQAHQSGSLQDIKFAELEHRSAASNADGAAVLFNMQSALGTVQYHVGMLQKEKDDALTKLAECTAQLHTVVETLDSTSSSLRSVVSDRDMFAQQNAEQIVQLGLAQTAADSLRTNLEVVTEERDNATSALQQQGAEIADLQATVQEVVIARDRLADTVQTQQQQLDENLQQISALQQALFEREEQCAIHTQQLEQAGLTIEQSAAAEAQQMAVVEEYKTAFDTCTNALQTTSAQLQALQAENSDISAQLAAAQTVLDATQAEQLHRSAIWQGTEQALQQQLLSAQAESQATTSSGAIVLAALQANIQLLQCDKDALLASQKQLQQTCEDVSSRASTMQVELTAQIASLNQSLISLQLNVGQLQVDKDGLSAHLSTITTDLQNSKEGMSALTLELSRAHSELSAQKELISQQHQQLEVTRLDLEQSIANGNDLYTQASTQAAELEVRQQMLEESTVVSQQLLDAVANLEQLRDENAVSIDTLHKRATQLQDALDEALVQLSTRSSALVLVQQNLQDVELSSEQARVQANEIISALTGRNEELNMRILSLQAESAASQDSLHRALVAAQVNIAQLQIDKDALQRQNVSSMQECVSASEQLTLVRTRLASETDSARQITVALQVHVQSLQCDKDCLSIDLKETQVKLVNAVEDAARQTEVTSQLQIFVDSLTIANDALVVDLESTRVELVQAQAQVESLLATRDELSFELDATRSNCQALDARCNDLANELSTAQEVLASTTDQLAARSDMLREAESSNQQLIEQSHSMQIQTRQAQAEVEHRDAEIFTLKDAVRAIEGTNRQLSENALELQQKLDAAYASAADQQAALRQEIDNSLLLLKQEELKLQDAHRQRADVNGKLESSRTECLALTRELDETHQQNAVLVAQIESESRQQHQLRDELQTCQNIVEALRRQQSDLQQEAVERKQFVASLEETVAVRSDMITELENKLVTHQMVMEQMQERIAEGQKDLQMEQDAHSKTKERIPAVEAEKSLLEQRCENIVEDARLMESRLREYSSALQQRVQESADVIATKEQQIAALNSTLADCRADVDTAKHDLAAAELRLQHDVAAAEQRLLRASDEAYAREQRSEAHIKSLSTELEAAVAVSAEVAELRVELQQMTYAHAQAEAAHQNAEHLYKAQRVRYGQLQEEYQILQVSHETLQHKCNQLQGTPTQLELLREEYAVLQGEYNALQQRSQSIEADMLAQLDTMEQDKLHSAAQVAQLEEAVVDISAQLPPLKQTIATQAAELEAAQNSLALLRADVAAKDITIHDLEHQIQGYYARLEILDGVVAENARLADELSKKDDVVGVLQVTVSGLESKLRAALAAVGKCLQERTSRTLLRSAFSGWLDRHHCLQQLLRVKQSRQEICLALIERTSKKVRTSVLSYWLWRVRRIQRLREFEEDIAARRRERAQSLVLSSWVELVARAAYLKRVAVRLNVGKMSRVLKAWRSYQQNRIQQRLWLAHYSHRIRASQFATLFRRWRKYASHQCVVQLQSRILRSRAPFAFWRSFAMGRKQRRETSAALVNKRVIGMVATVYTFWRELTGKAQRHRLAVEQLTKRSQKRAEQSVLRAWKVRHAEHKQVRQLEELVQKRVCRRVTGRLFAAWNALTHTNANQRMVALATAHQIKFAAFTSWRQLARGANTRASKVTLAVKRVQLVRLQQLRRAKRICRAWAEVAQRQRRRADVANVLMLHQWQRRTALLAKTFRMWRKMKRVRAVARISKMTACIRLLRRVFTAWRARTLQRTVQAYTVRRMHRKFASARVAKIFAGWKAKAKCSSTLLKHEAIIADLVRRASLRNAIQRWKRACLKRAQLHRSAMVFAKQASVHHKLQHTQMVFRTKASRRALARIFEHWCRAVQLRRRLRGMSSTLDTLHKRVLCRHFLYTWRRAIVVQRYHERSIVGMQRQTAEHRLRAAFNLWRKRYQAVERNRKLLVVNRSTAASLASHQRVQRSVHTQRQHAVDDDSFSALLPAREISPASVSPIPTTGSFARQYPSIQVQSPAADSPDRASFATPSSLRHYAPLTRSMLDLPKFRR
eukprot:TRINITY_DN2836_c0_g1_i2.p1 TRINITY_DN2836_c0_g1~~TRINITY_DN2836_c0_g1_i2.p1  ORF type:complete len:3419 (+),score=889.41 TRINITY_DN2836_c0_g1_i2:1507-10257(+)